MSKYAAYHNINNVKQCVRVNGESGTNILAVPYAVNLSLSPDVQEQSAYRDGRKVVTRYSDNGYTGSMGFGSIDVDLELAAGTVMESAVGHAKTSNRGTSRFDIYYEYTGANEDRSDKIVKNWLLNVSLGSPDENTETDTESIQFGEYVYPITVFGDTAKNADGTDFIDDNGFRTVVTRVFCDKDDEGFDTFGDSVPSPVVKKN